MLKQLHMYNLTISGKYPLMAGQFCHIYVRNQACLSLALLHLKLVKMLKVALFLLKLSKTASFDSFSAFTASLSTFRVIYTCMP